MPILVEPSADPVVAGRTTQPSIASARRPVFPRPRTTLKLRLSLLITLLIALMTVLGGGYIVAKARDDVRAEIRSTLDLTAHFLNMQLVALREQPIAARSIPQVFRLGELHDVRHLEVQFFDRDGILLDSNEAGGDRQPLAPFWFVGLVRSSTPFMDGVRSNVVLNGAQVGRLMIRPDPTYEIDEMWRIAQGLLGVLLLFFVLVNLLVWWAVSRALRPVETILGALTELEHGNLSVRLPELGLPELSSIGVSFNLMVETLERSVLENRRLTRRLVQTQEDERRNIARELHDEIGQCMSAIHADAAAIRNVSADCTSVRKSAEAIVEVTMAMKEMVRGLLRRLRADGLEDLGLEAALSRLTTVFRQRNPDMHCTMRMARIAAMPGSGETSAAVYRVVQESLSNIAMHTCARTVEIDVSVFDRNDSNSETMPVLEVSVRDDGRGFDPAAANAGFGLLGMRERVKALGGHISIQSAPSQGARVLVRLPLPSRTAAGAAA
jgi:two-component system sensor histidine kinase UhpB